MLHSACGRCCPSGASATLPSVATLRVIQGGAPAHSLPPLVVRLGLRDEFLLHEFEGYGTPLVARTIAQAKGAPGFASVARDRYGLGLWVDVDTWRNQIPVEDRPVSYGAAAFAARQALDLERHQLSPDEENAYVRLTFEELAICRATKWVAPYHLGRGPDCPIRGLDLRLARRAAARFRAMRLNEPPPNERFALARQLYGVIAIRPGDLLDPLARNTLSYLYSEIALDGYVLKVVGLSETTPLRQIEAVADFGFNLQLRSGRDVLLSGGKNLALAFVGAGLSAAILGISEGEVFYVRGQAAGGGARPVYHSIALRSVDTHSKSLAAGSRSEILFLRAPCGCGHHRIDLPPEGTRERKLHTMSERIRQFSEARSWGERHCGDEMQKLVRAADALAVPIGYQPLSDGFVAVTHAARVARRRFNEAAS
jgi:hypothetical protein